MHKDYYEGILQLRNPNKDVINFIKKETAKTKASITKEKKVKNGYDLYFTSNKVLKSLGYKLQKSFGGELKLSARLHTKDRQTSKSVYRLTVLFRLPSFKKGDLLLYRGEMIKILAVGKKVLAKRENGKKVTLRYSDLD